MGMKPMPSHKPIHMTTHSQFPGIGLQASRSWNACLLNLQRHLASGKLMKIGLLCILVWSLRRRRQNEQCRVSALTAGALALKPIKARRPIPAR